MGRCRWKAWVIAVASVVALASVGWWGALMDNEQRRASAWAEWVVLSSINRYREQIWWSSRVEYKVPPFGFHRMEYWLEDELRRPREAKVARVERCQLPVEVPLEPSTLALR